MHVAAYTRLSTSNKMTSPTTPRPMMCAWPKVLAFVMVTASMYSAQAATEAQNEPVPTAQQDAEAKTVLEGAAAQAAEMDKPLRGLSIQAHVGGGYMVADRKIPQNTVFPQLGGRNELLGAGPSADVTLGIDILEWLSLQLTGGMTLSGARRADYVHSLSQSYGAIGARFSIPFRDRWKANLTPAIAYYRQDNEVDEAQTGVGVMAQLGVEYYAHVRHFSVGADLAIQAALTPTRVFIGVMPHVRYTF